MALLNMVMWLSAMVRVLMLMGSMFTEVIKRLDNPFSNVLIENSIVLDGIQM